jgi:hypothetical protein
VFSLQGPGYVEVKTIPKPSIRFVAMQKWANPEDVNYNNGDFIRTFYFKARSQAEATKKLQKNSARQVVSFMPLLRMMSSNKWGRFVVVYSL